MLHRNEDATMRQVDAKSEAVFRVQIVIKEDGDDSLYAHCPQLGCIHVSAETVEEAKEAVCEATVAYLRMSMAHGDPIPIGIGVRKPTRARASKATNRREYRDEFLDVSLADAV